ILGGCWVNLPSSPDHRRLMALISKVPLLSSIALLSTIAPGAIADDAGIFHYPVDVVAAGEVLYVADLRLPGLWKVVDGKAEVFVQGEKRYRTPLNAIRCLALDE